MWSIGIDVHWRSFVMCILDEHGKRIKEIRGKGGWPKLLEMLRTVKRTAGRPLAVCYEASCGYGHLYDQLAEVARRVVVAHPGHLRLIFRSKRKNDRVDARKLATLLFLDQVPRVHVPRAAVRDWRQLIEFRQRLVRERVRVKNGLRSLLRSHGIEAPRCKALWTRKGVSWLAEQAFSTTMATVQRDMLLDELQRVHERLLRVERELKRIADGEPAVALLRTIPGVGPRTAEAVVAYIDDPTRFSCSRQVGSYFGLVPRQDQSADNNRLGHITREGPATVRKLLTEAAWQGVRRDARLRAYFERIRKDDPQRRKIALVATAHYLVRVMHAMLCTGQTWRGVQDARAA